MNRGRNSPAQWLKVWGLDTVAALGSKLDARDAVMYDDATGIIPRIKLIKTYLILKFGKDSAAYQQINALEFRKVK